MLTLQAKKDETKERKRKPITMSKLKKMKADGEIIAGLTAYDASMAQLMDKAGIDFILIGDSLGNVVQGIFPVDSGFYGQIVIVKRPI